MALTKSSFANCPPTHTHLLSRAIPLDLGSHLYENFTLCYCSPLQIHVSP